MMMRRILITCAALTALAAPASAQESALQPMEAPQTAPPPPPELCGVFFVDSERATYVPVPDYFVLTAAAPLAAPVNQPRMDALICDRPALVMGPNDHRVLTDLHVPLFIRNGGRVAVLEYRDNQLHLRFSEGAPTEAEMADLRAALDRAQDDIARMPAAASPG